MELIMITPMVGLGVLCAILGIFFFMNKEKLYSIISFCVAAGLIVGAIMVINDAEDSGRRVVTVSIDYYQEDGTFAGGPCFQIWIAYIGNDMVPTNETFTSGVFNDSMILESPFQASVELPENVISLSFTIKAYNGDIAENRMIDCESGTGYFISHTLTSPFEDAWTSNGSDDGFEDIDCSLTYSISDETVEL
ncbi:MAG: hypothetical protein E4H25_06265 [Methanomassiliicoccus sp.]|nr:MAG: hypothetical protein E4H25_06265 [Methanomassiliicoccus sp.]